MRQAILDAAENVGNVIHVQFGSVSDAGGITAYLERIAIEHPAVMCGLLSRLILNQQESTQTVDVTYHSFEEINNKLRELGLPVLGRPPARCTRPRVISPS